MRKFKKVSVSVFLLSMLIFAICSMNVAAKNYYEKNPSKFSVTYENSYSKMVCDPKQSSLTAKKDAHSDSYKTLKIYSYYDGNAGKYYQSSHIVTGTSKKIVNNGPVTINKETEHVVYTGIIQANGSTTSKVISKAVVNVYRNSANNYK